MELLDVFATAPAGATTVISSVLEKSPPASQSLGFLHHRLAGLDHLLDPLRQYIASAPLTLPPGALEFVDLDLLASRLGGAVGAMLAPGQGLPGQGKALCSALVAIEAALW